MDDFDAEAAHEIDVLKVPPQVLMSLSDVSTTYAASAPEVEPPGSFDVPILDGMAILHFLDPRGSLTFEDFANNVFLPYIWRRQRGLMLCVGFLL